MLAACEPTVEVLRVDLPVGDVPDAGAVLLAFRATNQARRLMLIDLEDLDPGTLELPVIRDLEDGARVEIELLYYRSRPAALGLTPGPLAVVGEGGTELRYFASDRFISARKLRLSPEAESEWETIETVDELPADILGARIGFDPCVDWQPVNGKVSACRHAVVALAAGANRVFFGTSDQRFWELELSDRSRLEPVPVPSPLGFPMRPDATDAQCAVEGTTSTSTTMVPLEQRVLGGLGRRDGHAWYGGWEAVHYVRAGQAPVTVPLPIPSGTVHQRGVGWLAGQPDPEAAEFEVYAMNSLGAVFRVTRGAEGFEAALIYDFEIPDAKDVPVYGGLAYPGPGRVVAVQGGRDQVLYYDHSQPSDERVSDQRRPYPGQGFSAALFVPGLGSLIAGEGARIFRHEEETDTWHPLEVTADWRSRIEALGPFRDGFVFGGTIGFMAQYALGPGFCRTRQLAPHTPRDIVELEDVVFAIGAKPSDKNETAFAVLGYE